MNKILNKVKVVLLFLVLHSAFSCNYLNVDEYFNDMIPLDTIFAKQEYIERYLWGAAGLLPNEGTLYSNSFGPYMTAVDETLMSWKKDEYGGTLLMADEITPFSNIYNKWGTYYKGIRKANTILTRIDECKDIDNIERRDILGMTYFLRGYFYYHLLMLYGPIPLLPDVPLSVDESIEELSFERNTYDECVTYICNDMEKAASLLEEKRVTSMFFRPTKFAAISLISRLKLHQASPWFNGNKFYNGWNNSKGMPMISNTYDEKKWAESAFASKRVIDAGIYSLHIVERDEETPELPNEVSTNSFPLGAGDVDPYRSYSDMFTGEALDVRNPEIIFPSSFAVSNIQIAFPLFMNGWNGLGVTHTLVEAYKKDNGNEVTIVYGDEMSIGSDQTFSGYTLKGTAAKRYENMEARFYASIGFCEGFWTGTSVTAPEYIPSVTNQTITYYVNGNCAPQSANPEDYNITGYTCKKYIHEDDNFYSSGAIKSKTYPILRYAEILLNYVEALNELTTSHSFTDEFSGVEYTLDRDIKEIVYYFNMIRYRAGLPGITEQDAMDVNRMRELIKRERMVEFAHEGRRYHDVRRWGIASETENMPVRGLDVTKKSQDRAAFYQVVNVDHKYAKRIFTEKMYFWPINNTTLRQNPKLVQNPYW